VIGSGPSAFEFALGRSIGSHRRRWMQFPRRRPIASFPGRAGPAATSRSSSSGLALHRVADGLEVEVARLDRRHHDGGADVARLRRAHPDRAAHRLEVSQHDDRALIEAEVLHRMADPTVLDQESAVAREAGVQDRARIERTDVESRPGVL
jgi:hypothetical protein